MIIAIILIILAVIIGIFLVTGGILSPLSSLTSSKNVGAVPVILNNSPQKIGLYSAFSQLPIGHLKYQNTTTVARIFSVTGMNLDNEGNADSWLFIARQQNKTKFIEVNGRGLTTSAWSGTVSGSEIDPMNVILPGDLFRTQQSKLRPYMDDNWNFYRIDLKNKNYTLTLKKESEQKKFVFNAINGGLIQG